VSSVLVSVFNRHSQGAAVVAVAVAVAAGKKTEAAESQKQLRINSKTTINPKLHPFPF
jgi:hypothetical protein